MPSNLLSELFRHNMGDMLPLLDDPEVLHISVSDTGGVWVEMFGTGPQDTGLHVPRPRREAIIREVASRMGLVVGTEHCVLETMLPSGERFEGLWPPLVLEPAFDIRRPAARIYPLEEYIEMGILAPAHAVAIKQAIAGRKNLVIAGACGTGKTTFVNACLYELRDWRGGRLLTVEDHGLRELKVLAPYYMPMFQVEGQVSLSRAVKITLRCNPSRVVVGEVRGPEALDVLDLWNTGHPGGMLTLHADPGKALRRLESLVRRAPLTVPLPQEELRTLIGEAVDVIVDIERIPEAPGRKVTRVTACYGVDEDYNYILEDL